MHKLTLSTYIHEKMDDPESRSKPGPYVTISREPGCEGYKVGDVLIEMLNDHDQQQRWRLYKKEILRQLAQDAELAEEIIERERHALPSLLKDFFRGMSKGNIPDGYEVRSKITTMVRTVAYHGHAVIIGQGGCSVTADIANGLSVRIEAPKEWRALRVSARDNLSEEQAIAKINAEEENREHLRKIYEESNRRIPTFNLVVDNSVLTAEQIASLIFHTMQLKAMLV